MHMLVTLRAVGEVLRPRATLSAPLLTLVGWEISRPHISPSRLASAAVVSFAMIGFAQVFNDIRDRHLDAVAKPNRPIPSGRLSLVAARCLAAVFGLLALVLGAYVGNVTLLLVSTGLGLGAVYSLWTKSTVVWGNALVAFVSCLTLLLALGSGIPTATMLYASGLIFTFVLGNELFKTGFDRDEDHVYGVVTLATRHGLSAIGGALVGCAGVLLVACGACWFLGPDWRPFAVASSVVIALPTAVSAALLLGRRSVTSKTLFRGHFFWRMAWGPGIAALLLL